MGFGKTSSQQFSKEPGFARDNPEQKDSSRDEVVLPRTQPKVTNIVPQFLSNDGSSFPIQLVGRVTLNGGTEAGERFSVPILSGPGLDEQWLLNQPPPISDFEQRQLARRGYRVVQDRRLVSVEMVDGNRLMIPFDMINVQYVGIEVH